MKRLVVREFLALALAAMASHSFADDHAAGSDKAGATGKTLAGYQRDCSSMTDARKKARCEEANKAMEACKGQKAENVANCVMEQRLRQRP